MKPVSFILVEDHTLFRDSVAEALEDSGRYQCAGSFSTMEEALDNITDGLQTHLVLLDLGLPGMSGLDGIGLIRKQLPDARVFILTAFHDREKVFAALKAGAHGYLIKTGGALKVLRTLDDVAEGGVPLDPQIAGMVLQAFQQLPPKSENFELSDQETEVLRRIAKGMTKKSAAHDMGLSLHTVDNYLRRAFEKLHVQSLPAAVAAAIRSGLLERP
ncbi:MAG: response regulator transcription factor [Verrucomicrobiota bacterium]